MTRTRLNIAVAAALLGTLALAGCKRDEPAPTPPPVAQPAPAPTAPAEAPPAAPVTVTAVDLGNSVSGDKRVTTPLTTFGATDTIYAAVTTNAENSSAESVAKLAARWTYQDGQVVDETAKDFSFTDTGTTAFLINKPDGWPIGRYKVEIMVDNEVVQTREFKVE